jgi:hypothetical protein
MDAAAPADYFLLSRMQLGALLWLFVGLAVAALVVFPVIEMLKN